MSNNINEVDPAEVEIDLSDDESKNASNVQTP